MDAEEVVSVPAIEQSPGEQIVRGSHRAMMEAGLIGERLRFPTLHSRANHGNHINASNALGNISTDCVKALPSEQLAGARHVVRPREPGIVLNVPLTKWGSRNAEA